MCCAPARINNSSPAYSDVLSPKFDGWCVGAQTAIATDSELLIGFDHCTYYCPSRNIHSLVVTNHQMTNLMYARAKIDNVGIIRTGCINLGWIDEEV